MIDTKELRRLVQAATHPTTKGRWMRLFGERTVYDRLEDGCRGVPIVAADHRPPGPQAAAYLDFIAAASPAAISELLDRLEAAENDAAHQKALAESALRVAEGWERKCSELRSSMKFRTSLIGRTEAERDALRAKIEAMEKQEPLYLFRRKGLDDFCTCSKERYEAFSANPRLFEVKTLYALPGAQIGASVPDGWLPVPEKHPTFDPVDLQLSDGSVLCGCVPQSDGDYWWEGPSGEVFIDPKYANVTHWRLAAAPEAKT